MCNYLTFVFVNDQYVFNLFLKILLSENDEKREFQDLLCRLEEFLESFPNKQPQIQEDKT